MADQEALKKKLEWLLDQGYDGDSDIVKKIRAKIGDSEGPFKVGRKPVPVSEEPQVEAVGVEVINFERPCPVAKVEVEPMKYFVNNLLPTGLVIWAGVEGVGKSTGYRSAIHAIETGQSFLGHPTHPAKSLVIDFEAPSITKERFLKIGSHQKVDMFNPDQLDGHRYYDEVGSHGRWLVSVIRSKEWDIIWLDSSKRYFAGGVGRHEVGDYLTAVNGLCIALGISLVLVDHTSEANPFKVKFGGNKVDVANAQITWFKKRRAGAVYVAGSRRGIQPPWEHKTSLVDELVVPYDLAQDFSHLDLSDNILEVLKVVSKNSPIKLQELKIRLDGSVNPRTVKSSLNRLVELEIVSKVGRGVYAIK